jgi:hypothetical protein
MPNINLYANLQDYKNYAVARNQSASTDQIDDSVIVDLLEKASRDLDDMTGRQFYPSIETETYDVPDGDELTFDRDVLQIISLSNGDGTSISASNYIFKPANFTPHYALRLREGSSVEWEADTDNNTEQVIDMVAWCGYREKYNQRAWKSVGTLGAAITDTTTLAFTMTAGHTVAAGSIVKIDNEIFNINAVAGETVTPLMRGDNGSTAATHLISAVVYKWIPQEQAKGIVLELANAAYNRRFGKVTGESAQVTAAGVVLSPRGLSAESEKFIKSFARLV